MSASVPPDHAGFLDKTGGKFIAKNQTRWFELRGTKLHYYKTRPTTDEEREETTGTIDLRHTTLTDNPKEKFSWSIIGPNLSKTYTLLAASEEDKKQWIYKMEHPNLNYGGKEINGNNADGKPPAETKPIYGKVKVTPDDFHVVRVIGKGSFGKVMEVVHKATNKTYAMKEMSKIDIERQNLLEHIFAEKSILQKISHPYIVSLHFAFQSKEKLYLILDFLSGGELFFHLSNTKFPEPRARFYAAQIGHALGHLHSLDIIYRDLKPENAVLDKDGNVCLTDFGLAKTNVSAQDAAQTFCGTPEYLAPEFLRGGGHGKAVDWWSLGILIYEMLVGIPPFYSENLDHMYELILQKPLDFSGDARDVSPQAQDLITKLLDRNPETRLQDVKVYMAHPFFKGLNWDALARREIPAPFIPDKDPEKNFDKEFTSLAPRLSVAASSNSHAKDMVQFSYDRASK